MVVFYNFYCYLHLQLLFIFIIFLVYGQQPAAESDCPEKNGVFADSVQCDRYYECSNFVLAEKLCPDGLVFADLGTNAGEGRCDFPFNVDCTGRPELRTIFQFVHFLFLEYCLFSFRF